MGAASSHHHQHDRGETLRAIVREGRSATADSKADRRSKTKHRSVRLITRLNPPITLAGRSSSGRGGRAPEPGTSGAETTGSEGRADGQK